MKFSGIYNYSQRVFAKNNMLSDLHSMSDPTGTNIGHTVPGSYENWDSQTLKSLKAKKWEKVKDVISKHRVFINRKEDFKIKKGMAFTIEPRPSALDNSTIPSIFLHTIALFKENGSKELLTGFNPLFKLAGMNYMLNI